MVMKMCLVGFLKIFSLKIFSQTNQKMKTIFFVFNVFSRKHEKNENADFSRTRHSLSFFLPSTLFPILLTLFLFFFPPQTTNPQSLHFLSLHFFSFTRNHSLTPLSIDPTPPHHHHCSAAPLPPQHHFRLIISW